MGVKGFGSVIKYSMFLFNAVILVAGAALVGFGIYTRQNSDGVMKFSSIAGSGIIPTISLSVIITGAIIILLAFLGCCGAIKEVRCMLVTYFLLLLLMFLAILVGGILAYVFWDKAEDITLQTLTTQVTMAYGMDGEEKVTESWDNMQSKLHCCGVVGGINSSNSWSIYKLQSKWYTLDLEKRERGYVPSSCCVDPSRQPNRTQCMEPPDIKMPKSGPPVKPQEVNDQLYTTGCYTAFEEILKNNMWTYIGIIGGILFIMILGMVFSLCLCMKIRDYDYDCDD